MFRPRDGYKMDCFVSTTGFVTIFENQKIIYNENLKDVRSVFISTSHGAVVNYVGERL